MRMIIALDDRRSGKHIVRLPRINAFEVSPPFWRYDPPPVFFDFTRKKDRNVSTSATHGHSFNLSALCSIDVIVQNNVRHDEVDLRQAECLHRR